MTTKTKKAPSDAPLPSENQDHGFWRTAELALSGKVMNGPLEMDRDQGVRHLWREASLKLIHEHGLTPTWARVFLDSRDGRHLADAILNLTLTGEREGGEVHDHDLSRFTAMPKWIGTVLSGYPRKKSWEIDKARAEKDAEALAVFRSDPRLLEFVKKATLATDMSPAGIEDLKNLAKSILSKAGIGV